MDFRTAGTEYFHLLESDAAVTINHTGTILRLESATWTDQGANVWSTPVATQVPIFFASKEPGASYGVNWSRPVPGNTSETAWKGTHPLEDLVQIKNPPQGYMQNNNVAPDTMME